MSYGLNGRKRGAVNSEFREIENLERLGIAQTTFIPNLLTFTKFLNLPNNSLCSLNFALVLLFALRLPHNQKKSDPKAALSVILLVTI